MEKVASGSEVLQQTLKQGPLVNPQSAANEYHCQKPMLKVIPGVKLAHLGGGTARYAGSITLQ